MSAPGAGVRLVDGGGSATPIFWKYLIEQAEAASVALPSQRAALVDGQGRAAPIFLRLLAALSTTVPHASVALVDMRTGLATPFFDRWLEALP